MFEGNCCIRVCCEKVQRESLRASCYLGLELELLTVTLVLPIILGGYSFLEILVFVNPVLPNCLPSVRRSLKVSDGE